jgi:signal transduction histidine kinase
MFAFTEKEIISIVLVGTFITLLLAVFLVSFVYFYQRRRFAFLREKQQIKSQFQEELLKAQLEMQEQTFRAIGEEIHDNVGQLLSLARVQINIIDESGLLDKAVLYAARENIGKALMELRDLSKSLHTERLQNLSIHETLLQEAERLNRVGVLKASIQVEGVIRELDSQKRLILFRILQESIQNCLKHAEATELAICFVYREGEVGVSIRDNGKGFDPVVVAQRREGQGLGNVRNRVRLTGGQCVISSALLSGTEINLTIPYE